MYFLFAHPLLTVSTNYDIIISIHMETLLNGVKIMAKKDRLTENKAETKKRKKKVTAWDIISFIIVILALGAGLFFSFINFTEHSFVVKTENGAHGIYAAVQKANVNVGYVKTSDEVLSELKKYDETLVSMGATHTVSGEYISLVKDGSGNPIKEIALKEGDSFISDITVTGAGFNFTYYTYLNGRMYICTFTEGILGEVTFYEIN